jgi:twitching motility protein PilT
MSNGVHSALRQNPSMIVVGEMIEKDEISACLRAASSGHLVLGSLHTNSARDTIEAILSCYRRGAKHSSEYAGIPTARDHLAAVVPYADGNSFRLVTEVLIVNKQVKNAIRDRNYNELANLMETKQNGSSSYTMNSEHLTPSRTNRLRRRPLSLQGMIRKNCV